MKATRKGPPLVSSETSIALRDDHSLTLAIVADTHSAPHKTGLRYVRELAPDAILHAGDIGDLSVLDTFREIAPLVAVRGNIDERAQDLPDVVRIELRAGEQSALTLLMMHIAVYGPKLRADAARLAYAAEAKLLVCGHSHVPFIGRDRGITLFNPGSIGPRRMHLPILFGVMRIANGKLSLRHIDAETGQEWAP